MINDCCESLSIMGKLTAITDTDHGRVEIGYSKQVAYYVVKWRAHNIYTTSFSVPCTSAVAVGTWEDYNLYLYNIDSRRYAYKELILIAGTS